MAELKNDSFNARYKVIEKIGEGSYSEVLKCRHRETGDLFACKRLKHNYRGWNEVGEISEIKSLRTLIRHPNILEMTEVHFDPSTGRVCLVFEIMDKNLYELIKDRKRMLSESKVKSMLFQLVRGLRHLHKHGIFHRDVKPENILLKSVNPNSDLLKLGDLGSVRGLYSKPPYTEYISTRWYRSPECLLTAGHYSFKMDIWAAGCVFYEILTLRPLFPGSSELDQINRIHNILGPPPARILQKYSSYKSRNFDWYFAPSKDPSGTDRLLPAHVSNDARELLKKMLQYDPDSRPSSHRVLQHAYFNDLREKFNAKEIIDDGIRPIVTIVGDAHASAVANGNAPAEIDLRTVGDNKMLLKLRRHKEVKEPKTSHAVELPKPKPAPLGPLGGITNTVNSGIPRREEAKTLIHKKPILPVEHAKKPPKSRNLDWYYVPKKDPPRVERLPPVQLGTDTRDKTQFEPESRPSSNRVLQHGYFNEMRRKINAKKITDDGTRANIPIAGDPYATPATNENPRPEVDLRSVGDNKMLLKMRRHKEQIKALNSVEQRPKVLRGLAVDPVPSLTIEQRPKVLGGIIHPSVNTKSGIPRREEVKSIMTKKSLQPELPEPPKKAYKSRNYEWYFASNKDSPAERLPPIHINTDARNKLQYNEAAADSQVSSNRLLQNAYFNDLRRKINAKKITDDGGRATQTIIGDPYATAAAHEKTRAEVEHVRPLGESTLMKLRRQKEQIRASIAAEQSRTKVLAGINNPLANTSSGIPRREEPALKPPPILSKKIVSQLEPPRRALFTKAVNHQLMNEAVKTLKYKRPMENKQRVDSKGYEADVETPLMFGTWAEKKEKYLLMSERRNSLDHNKFPLGGRLKKM